MPGEAPSAAAASEAARLLAASRRRSLVTCIECGRRFEALAHRRYCSHSCYMRTWRRKKAADLAATGRAH